MCLCGENSDLIQVTVIKLILEDNEDGRQTAWEGTPPLDSNYSIP